MIRVAHLFDIPVMLGLAKQYVEEIGAAGLFVPQLDPELAAVNMMNTLQSETGLAIVCVVDGKVIGYLWAFVVQPTPWSSHLTADCQMFYVDPAYRGGRHFFNLLKAFKVWADMMDCVETRISTASGIDTKVAEGLFQHAGFSLLGKTFHSKKEK